MKKNKSKVSIIVPIYNKEEILSLTVDSLITQTYENIEIILVDDCSTDKSLEIARQYKKKDSRIIVVEKKINEGGGIARYTGIKKASGEYIGFFDAGDFMYSDAVETMLKNFEDDVEIIFCDFVFYKNYADFHKGEKQRITKGTSRIITREEALIGLFNGEITQTIWDKLYRADIIKNAKSRLRHGDDLEYNLQAFQKITKGKKIPEQLIGKIHDEASLGEAVKKKRHLIHDELFAYEQAVKVINSSINSAQRQEVTNKIYLILLVIRTRYYQRENKKYKEWVTGLLKEIKEKNKVKTHLIVLGAITKISYRLFEWMFLKLENSKFKQKYY